MKRIVFIFIVILLSGCGKTYYNTYHIINKTDKNIRIEGFALKWSQETNRVPIYSEVINIEPNAKFTIQKGIGESWEPQGIFSLEDIDSSNIIFNEIRIIKYKCNNIEGVSLCNDIRNIINYQEYYNKNCGKHECTYTYTITEEDYESAEVIVKKIN
jgi:hypothetical protein